MTQEDIWDLLRLGQEEMTQNLERAMGPRCGIKHGFGDQTCIR